MTTRTKTDELALVARVRFLLKIVGDQFFGVDQHLGNRIQAAGDIFPVHAARANRGQEPDLGGYVFPGSIQA